MSSIMQVDLPEDTFRPYISPKRPDDSFNMKPLEARALFRTNDYTGFTSGFCDGYTQFNIIIISSEFADDFETFCSQNSGAFPVLYRSKPGEVGAPPIAEDSNVRTDLPCYTIRKNGIRVAEAPDLSRFTPVWDYLVTFYIGCSTTFDFALIKNGVDVPNVLDIPGYKTNVCCSSVGPFQGVKMTVSMRTIAKHQLEKAFMISNQYPDYHGAPIHIGDPTRIGISGVTVPDGYVATFWACGMTVEDVILIAKPELAFSHYPGAMFIGDIKREPTSLGDAVKIIKLNKAGCEYFASVINQNSIAVFEGIQRALGIKPINVQVNSSPLLEVTLKLSHANKVVLAYIPKHSCQHIDVLGIMVFCQALLILRKGVTLVVKKADKNLFDIAIQHMVETFHVDTPTIVTVSQNVTIEDNIPVFDCLLMTSQNCYDAVKGILDIAQKNSHTSVITLNNYHCKATEIESDIIVTENLVNSAYALAGGLYVASTSPYHWRYKNYSINSHQQPQFSVDDFIPTNDQSQSLWKMILPKGSSGSEELPNLCPVSELRSLLNCSLLNCSLSMYADL